MTGPARWRPRARAPTSDAARSWCRSAWQSRPAQSARSSTSHRVTFRRAKRGLVRSRRPRTRCTRSIRRCEAAGRTRSSAASRRMPSVWWWPPRSRPRGASAWTVWSTSTVCPSPRAPRRPTLEVSCARVDPPTTSATRERQRSMPSRRPPWLSGSRRRGVRCAVCDAATDADLDVIARAWSAALRRRARGHGCSHRRSGQRRVAARRSSA